MVGIDGTFETDFQSLTDTQLKRATVHHEENHLLTKP